MNYRSGNPADLAHLETFVWQAIFPAFDHPELTEEQRAANDQVVEEARNWAVRAMGREDEMLYIAHDPARGQLAGLIWAKGGNNPRIVLIIVARRYWGQGVAAKLLEEATFWLGDSKPVSARVRHYNERAQAFFAKHGFEITEEVDDDFPIQRVIMLRPAGYQSEAEDDMDQLDLGFEFPEPELEPSNTTEDLLDLTEPYAQRRASDTPPPISKFPHIELEIESAGADKEEKPFQSEAEPKDNLTAAEAIGDDLPPFEFAFQPPVKTQYVKTQNFASPDSASPDSASPDSASPDSASPDSASPDSASPDSTSPDSTSPDSTSPDSTSPDSTSPDSTSPDST
ncbi:MAG: GNAT family N-acetyltransferase, partial [Bacteroidota bacterium]